MEGKKFCRDCSEDKEPFYEMVQDRCCYYLCPPCRRLKRQYDYFINEKRHNEDILQRKLEVEDQLDRIRRNRKKI
jgi:hypothetical protein